MRKIIILFFLLLSLFSSKVYAWETGFPLKTISKPDCRFTDFEDLSSNCKMQIPSLNPDEYSKLKNDFNMRRIYTVLWWATYTYGWDVWSWSHLWVDIATSKWTPVYSIASWTVAYSWFKSWWGNVVSIKHNIAWKTIYSNYAHLEKTLVKKGQSVSKWSEIWKVGSTWNSTWNHLHFQIDTNTDASNHPYFYYKNCPTNPWWTVNRWGCRPDLLANTLDPIAYLNSKWEIVNDNTKIEESKKREVSKRDLITREEIERKEVDRFLRQYDLIFDVPNSGVLSPWESIKIDLTVLDTYKDNRPFKWSFPWNLNFSVSPIVDVFPENLKFLSYSDNGSREIFITAKTLWRTNLNVLMWKTLIKRIPLSIIKKWQTEKVESSKIIWASSSYVWRENKYYAISKNKDNRNIIWIPFDWKIYISSNKDWKFCPFDASAWDYAKEISKSCSLWDSLEKMALWNWETIKSVVIFWYRWLEIWTHTITFSDGKYKVYWTKKLRISLPKWLAKNDVYYDSAIWALSKWIISPVSWKYFREDDRVKEKDFVDYLKNALAYKRNKNNTVISFSQINAYEPSSEFITRGEALDLIWRFAPNSYLKNAIIYSDLSDIQNVYANKFFDKNYTFKDRFWHKAFRPSQTLTLWETAYILDNLAK